jgi:hypothetical protein
MIQDNNFGFGKTALVFEALHFFLLRFTLPFSVLSEVLPIIIDDRVDTMREPAKSTRIAFWINASVAMSTLAVAR